MEDTSKRFVISVDGSQYSEWGFDLIVNDFYTSGDHVLVIHIYNSAKLNDIPFAYQPDTIMSKYETKLLVKLPTEYYLLTQEERLSNTEHSLAQANRAAVKYQADLLTIGFQGHKAGKDKNEFTKGVAFLMKNVKIPTLVMKENSRRENKAKGGFIWLMAIEDCSTRSYKAFQYALQFINKSVDTVIGLHIHGSDKTLANQIQVDFESVCDNEGIANRSFLCEMRDTTIGIGKQISNMINFNNEMSADFLVMGNNPSKYDSVDEMPLAEVMRNASVNVLFYY